MDAEDFQDIEAERIVANRASGYNGSLEPFRFERHEAEPCPPSIRERLQQLRAAALERAEVQRKRGLCL